MLYRFVEHPRSIPFLTVRVCCLPDPFPILPFLLDFPVFTWTLNHIPADC